MNSNVEIISKEIIKPSSKTPDHLKIFELSIFDRFAPSVYVPIIFFYEANELRGLVTSNHVQISQNLKKSLSLTLTSCYPLAGRARDDGSVVDCNDAGAEFVEARVHTQLTESTQESDAERLKTLLPFDPVTVGFSRQGILLLVQLNFFDCGGIAIGICVSHQMADAASIMTFVTAWAATNRGENGISQFNFQLSRYFPAKEFLDSRQWKALSPDKNIATKMFMFTKEIMAALKRAAISTTESTVEDPTRVELVSAFIWQHLSEFYNNHPERGPFAAFHSVNLRARVGQNHQHLQDVFGNFVAAAFLLAASDDGVGKYHDSVRKIRTSIRSIDFNDYISNNESQNSKINYIRNLFTSGKFPEWYFFTSWCKFPLYEVDFDLGKPILACVPRGAMKNGIVLMDSKNGEDIQVWVNMDQEILDILEAQIKLI